MNIYLLYYNSIPAIYIIQTVFYALIAIMITERSIMIWQINDPYKKQFFHYIPILIPPICFFLYETINPERMNIPYRGRALFDINSILFYEVFDLYPFFYLFLLIIFISTLIFILQEVLPLIIYKFKKNDDNLDTLSITFKHESTFQEILKDLKSDSISVEIIDSDQILLIFSLTGKTNKIILSKCVIDILNKNELKAVIAHELAHIRRNKKYILIFIYIFRILQFYSPVALLQFRRIINLEEIICDKIASDITQNPQALAKALYKLFIKNESTNKNDIERNKILYRIKLLRFNNKQKIKYFYAKLFLTLISIVIINYYII